MNKQLFSYFIIFGLLISFSSCKSLVTAQDVMKQKNKSAKAVVRAEQELVALARLKEEYSVDVAKSQIKTLSDRQEIIKKDIKKLKGVEGKNTVKATSGVLSNLEKKNESISNEIKQLENNPKENWQASVDSIKNQISMLTNQIQEITQSVEVK